MFKGIIIGNLGADCEIRNENGRDFITFKIAHNERYTASDGTKKDSSVWISCVMSGRNENLTPYLKKGTCVSVIGDIRVKTYHSERQRALVAGADCFVRSLDLVGSKPDLIPGELYDYDGCAHKVSKFYFADVDNKIDKLWDRNQKSYKVANGWVTPDTENDAEAQKS